jgi:hypothetical protein
VRDDSKSRNAGPVKCNALFGGTSEVIAFVQESFMLAIAGAVLIHAACVLMASVLIAKGEDTVTIYALTRILLFVGAGLMAVDIQGRIREFIKKAKAGSTSEA